MLMRGTQLSDHLTGRAERHGSGELSLLGHRPDVPQASPHGCSSPRGLRHTRSGCDVRTCSAMVAASASPMERAIKIGSLQYSQTTA